MASAKCIEWLLGSEPWLLRAGNNYAWATKFPLYVWAETPVAGHLKLEWMRRHQGEVGVGHPQWEGVGVEEVVVEHSELEGVGDIVTRSGCITWSWRGWGHHCHPEPEGMEVHLHPQGERWGRDIFTCLGIYSQFENKVLNNTNIIIPTIGDSIHLGSSAWILHANNIKL